MLHKLQRALSYKHICTKNVTHTYLLYRKNLWMEVGDQ